MRNSILAGGAAALLSAVLAVPALAIPLVLPVCGDVNKSGSVNTSDALLVLRKGVGQTITLDCSAYDSKISSLQTNLQTCEARPVCGNSTIESGEDCELEQSLADTCGNLGYDGGTLACSPGCAYDTSGCWNSRFDASEGTILDRQTGLQWEKKDGADGVEDYDNPHDVDNAYTWSGTDPGEVGTVFSDFLAKLNYGVSYPLSTTTVGCYAGHCDWRLPTREEMKTIIGVSLPACTGGGSCTYDDFLPEVGASGPSKWTLSTYGGAEYGAWIIDIDGNEEDGDFKNVAHGVRAVRKGEAGSPTPCQGYWKYDRCWFLGAVGENCTETCEVFSMAYDSATAAIAGSSGSNEACEVLLDGVGAAGSGLDYPDFEFVSGVGCAVDSNPLRARVISPGTTASASTGTISRVCACR